MDFVVVAKIAVVAIFPNVASVGIEERVVSPAIGELNTGESSVCYCSLGLNDRLQNHHRKQQSDDCDDRLGVKITTHVSVSKSSVECGRKKHGNLEANMTEALQIMHFES